MKITLSLKIFLSFLVLSVLSVTAMVVVIRYFGHRSFGEYIQRKETERVSRVTTALATYYQEHKGWDELRRDQAAWMLAIDPEGAGDFRPPGQPSGLSLPPPTFRPPLPPPMGGPRPPGPPPPPGDFGPPNRIPRFVLFDQEKNKIAGGPGGPENYSLTPIAVAGKTVGWLGLHSNYKPLLPLDQEFLKEQTRVLYATGGIILLISSLMAFLLARHLLAPIKKLTLATASITSRDFDTRVQIDSSDELGQLGNDFNAMALTLGEFERRQQQWLADISHEMRTPLTILLGEIEALQDGVRKPNTECLSSLHAEAVHLSKIIADLHTLSLSDAGTLHLEKIPVQLLQILSQTIKLFQARFDQNRITVHADLAGLDDAEITGDPDRLAQVFSNLFENALRYVKQPGDLTILGKVAAGKLTISIEDSGPGVPEDALPRLFDRLFRVDKSRDRATGGSGLGLAICKSIIEGHAGDIRAMKGESGGLRFEIEIPLR